MTHDQATLGDRVLAASTARLLRAAARCAGALGLGCAGVAAAALLLGPMGGWARWAAWGVLVLLPVERVLALRAGFDAGLFRDLARQPAPQAALGALDLALQTLGLRQPSTVTRPLPDRVRGAQRLLVWHGLCVGLQFGAGLALVATRGPA